MTKRILSMFLVLAICLSTLPTTVLAEGEALAEEYTLCVGGILVTGKNEDVLSDGGTVKYEPGTEINTLTLNNATISGGEQCDQHAGAGIYYYGEKPLTINLAAGSKSTVTAAKEDSGFPAAVKIVGDLNIEGSGELVVISDTYDVDENTSIVGSFGLRIGGNLSIYGGTITAFAGNANTYSYAIEAGGNINISGGTVYANYSPKKCPKGCLEDCQDDCPSWPVPGGSDSDVSRGIYSTGNGSEIKICGATVHAFGGTGQDSSYGIAGTNGVSINIEGDTVTAIGGESTGENNKGSVSAGIYTSANYGDGGTVTISGGIVTATGEKVTAADGTVDLPNASVGIWADNGGKVEITNGEVTATGGEVIAADGTVDPTGTSAGIWAEGGKGVEITGGEVTATGGNVGNTSSGIYTSAEIAFDSNETAYISVGNVTISGGTVTANGGDAGNTSSGIYASADIKWDSEDTPYISGGNVTISDGTVTATGGKVSLASDTSVGIWADTDEGKVDISDKVTITASGKKQAIKTGGGDFDNSINNNDTGVTIPENDDNDLYVNEEPYIDKVSNDNLDIEWSTTWKFVQRSRHEHNWVYTLTKNSTTNENDTITATCSNTDGYCSLKDCYGGSVTISASGGEYDRSSKGATLEYSDWQLGDAAKPSISYIETSTPNESFTTNPVYAGEYTASITMGEGEKAVTASVTYTIEKKNLEVSFTVSDKTYDGNTTASFASGPALVGVVGDDKVTLSTEAAVTFATAAAAENINIICSNFEIKGDDASNYTLVTPEAVTADITKKKLEVTFKVKDKTYDGNTTATFASGPALVGVIGNDEVKLSDGGSIAFTTADAGEDIAIVFTNFKIEGTHADNYELPNLEAKANITKKELTVKFKVADKTYDGNTTATFASGSALVGVIGNDDVKLSDGGSIAFATAAAVDNIAIVFSDFKIEGDDADNYELLQPSAKANITKKKLKVNFEVSDKTYDGNTTATFKEKPKLEGVIGDDNVTLSEGTITFESPNVATGIAIVFKDFGISGTDAGNYELPQLEAKADITRKKLEVTFEVSDKTYDGNTTATFASGPALEGVIGKDDVKLSDGGSIAFATAAAVDNIDIVFTDFKIEGTHAGNYELPELEATANIKKKVLRVDFEVSDKTYDGGTAATFKEEKKPKLEGVIGNDNVTLSEGTIAFKTADVAKGIAIIFTGFKIEGTHAGNYELPMLEATADINNAGQDAPTLTPIHETIRGKGDGQISGLDITMEWSNSKDGSYQKVTNSSMGFAAGTYYVRYPAKKNYNASEPTEVIIEAGDQLTVILPKDQTGYIMEVTGETMFNYLGGTTLKFTLLDGYSDADLKVTADNADLTNNENGTYTISNAKNNVTITVSGVADKTAPDVTLSVKKVAWKEFIHDITFGLFFKDYVDVTVEAADSGSGIQKAEYRITKEAFENIDAVKEDKGEWTPLELKDNMATINVTENGKKYVYVRVFDKAGNITVVNPDKGVVVYEDSQLVKESISYTKNTTEPVAASVKLNGNTINAIYIVTATGGTVSSDSGTGNGETLINKENYAVDSEGVITFQAAYLNTLAVGDYTLHIEYNPQGEKYDKYLNNDGQNINDEPARTSVKLTVRPEGTVSITGNSDKIYDGKSVDDPAYVNPSGGEVTVEWYKGSVAEENKLEKAPTDAGSYVVRVSVAANNNYPASYDEQVVTISPKDIAKAAITLGDKLTYDGSEQTQSVSSVTVDTLDVTYTVSNNKGTNAGDYTLTVTGTGNFTGTATKDFTIAKREIKLVWSNTEFIYDGNSKIPSATVGNLVQGDTCNITVTDAQTEANTDDTPTYTATAVSVDNDNYVLPENKTTTFVIKPASQKAPDIESENESISGKGDGRLTGLTTEMEISTDNVNYTSITDEDTDTNKDYAPGIYYVRYPAKKNYNASEPAEVTINVGRKLKVILPEDQTGYTIEVTGETEFDYLSGTTLKLEALSGYTVDNLEVTNAKRTDNKDGTYIIFNATDDVKVTVKVSGVADKTAPDVTLSIKEVDWKQFIHNITFGLFFKDNVEVKVEAADSGSGIEKAEYLITETAFIDEKTVKEYTGEWKELTLKDNTATIHLDENGRKHVYVRVSDKAGNITVVNPEGVVVYEDSQQDTESISYTKTKTKTTAEPVVVSVKLNGNTVKDIYIKGVSNEETLIGKENYTVGSEGKITFNAAYLDSLDAGDYTLHIEYNPQGETYGEYPNGDKNINDEPARTSVKLTVRQEGTVSITGNLDKTYDAEPVTVTASDFTTDSTGETTIEWYQGSVAEGNKLEEAPTNAGSYVVRISVAEDDKYTASHADKAFTIARKDVTITGTAVEATKTYDGSTSAKITSNGTLSVNYDSGNVSIVPGTATYADKNVGIGKTVTFTGFALTGSAAGNYNLTAQPVDTTADIKPANLTVNVKVNDKQYDGLNTATIDGDAVLQGVVSGDDVILANGIPTFATVTVGENIPINFTSFTISGGDAANYNLIQPAAAATIYNSYEPEVDVDYTINTDEWMAPDSIVTANDWINTDFSVKAKDGYMLSLTGSDDGVWSSSLTATEETADGKLKFYVRKESTNVISLIVIELYKIDKTPATGTVSIAGAESTSDSFLETITFDQYFNDKQEITIETADNLSGVSKIEYYEAAEPLSLAEIKDFADDVWTEMDDSVEIALEDGKQFVYYIRLTDIAGNISYLSSNGAEYDITAPVISGVENGAAYYTTQSVTVTDKNLKSVTVNGVAVEDLTAAITLEGNQNTDYKIVAADAAGNITTVTVTMKKAAEPDKENSTEPDKENSDSPQTGDNSNLWLWFAVLFVSGGCFFGVAIYGKKRT